MKSKVYEYLRLFIWASIGVFIGKVISVYTFYREHPGFYELNSAPWYAELVVPFVLLIVEVIVLSIIRVILKRKINN